MATQTLADWAASLTPESLPASVKNAARRSLYNYVGCAIGGSNHPTVTKAHAALSPFFGAATSSLLGHNNSWSTDAQHAALLNGISSHIHDFDDTHLATIIHPTGPVASAILSYAEYIASSTSADQHVSGPQLLCALVAGIEASCKLGLSVWPTHYDIGWHITSTTGSIGAAIGVGILMRLDPERMAHAIGIAATQVVGLRDMFGTDTKSFHPGRAAQSGLLAALLAQRGYTSSPHAIEAKRGWANVVVGGGTPQLEKYIGQLGRTWEIEANSFKPFPCGIVCHPAIDGSIQIHSELKFRRMAVDDIVHVEEKVHPLVIELTSKKTPKDGLEGKFSVYHGSAVGLLYGKAGPSQYADEVVTDPEVITIRDKIEAASDDHLAADEVHVKVVLKDGNTLEKHVQHAVGSLELPMTDEQLTEKFIDQCSIIMGDNARRASDIAWKVGDADNITQLLSELQKLSS